MTSRRVGSFSTPIRSPRTCLKLNSMQSAPFVYDAARPSTVEIASYNYNVEARDNDGFALALLKLQKVIIDLVPIRHESTGRD
jgi:hypothetical protein